MGCLKRVWSSKVGELDGSCSFNDSDIHRNMKVLGKVRAWMGSERPAGREGMV